MSRKSLDLTHCILLALTLWQAVSHFRHVPFFAILCGFWLGPHLHSMLQRWTGRSGQSNPRLETGASRWLASGACLAMAVILSVGLAGRLQTIQVERDVFPVDAFQFMADHELNGRIVITYDWAQYAIAAFCTDDLERRPGRVAFDGRFRTCYPQQVVDMHFDFLFGEGNGVPRSRSEDSPPCDPSRVLEFGKPNLVVLRRKSELTEKHMNRFGQEWIVLYEDGLAQVCSLTSRMRSHTRGSTGVDAA